MSPRARHSRVLIGNALSLMIAATRIAQAGIPVTIVNATRNWGGHFSTVSCNGVPFDPGMVLHEFTSFSTTAGATNPLTYNPAVKNDCGRFCDVVRDYVAGYQLPREIPTPSMYLGGRVYDDLLIANSLSTLNALPFARAIESELSAIVCQGNRSRAHASLKYQSPDFSVLDFETVSLANHGATFHSALIEPFCRKLLNVSSREVVALYHRAAWLPLYYPETLLSYLRGTPQTLPPTAFSYPRHECVGDLAGKLRTEIETNGLITVINDRPSRVVHLENGSFEIDFPEQPGLTAGALAWANSPGDLLLALECDSQVAPSRRCSIALSFLQIPTGALLRDFTTLSVVDPEHVVYRITNQTRCAGDETSMSNLVAEINPDYALARGVANTDLDLRLKEELVSLGIVADTGNIDILQTRQMRNALLVPDAGNLAACALEMSAIRQAVADVQLLGPASGFFTSSFNDQVVQGMKLASLWSGRS